ncbi:hypothetical protein ALC56_10012 [Trachymyrmex septentrionalis]|uniref:Uncharacterized protein n=1 Tax=Trachymyrmex septentrionalis TaxID=34720 RepID=A0A195F4E9_9HYME|nr:hypothetical protein ALC56_10012 [Trachymyrmex septentrionalis]
MTIEAQWTPGTMTTRLSVSSHFCPSIFGRKERPGHSFRIASDNGVTGC